MARIADLPVEQLARHAANVFIFQGRNPLGARLIYEAVLRDPYHPDALRCLSDFLDYQGTEGLSAAVLEHLLTLGARLSPAQRGKLDDLRFFLKWVWGFSRHRSGATDLPGEAFGDRSQFDVDESRYRAWLAATVGPTGSLEGACHAAHTLVGVIGGLLRHRSLGEKAPWEELFHPDHFSHTPAYAGWLEETTEKLDALERQRQQASK
jgi:hypothetical protein